MNSTRIFPIFNLIYRRLRRVAETESWGFSLCTDNLMLIPIIHVQKHGGFFSQFSKVRSFTTSCLTFERKEGVKKEYNDIHLIDQNGKSRGLMSLQQAKLHAQSEELSLHLVKSPTHNHPHPVYKLLSKKDIYDMQKKAKEKERNLSKNKLKPKELSFSTDIAGQDLSWKLKKIEEFLVENFPVKVIVNQKMRSKVCKNEFLESILKKLEEFGTLDGNLVETGRRIKFYLKPVQKLKKTV